MAEITGGIATTLDTLNHTLRPDPLTSKGELDKFYRAEVNQVRGEDTVARLSRKLQQAYGSVPFKTFVMGHSGVGKSTELSRLLNRVHDQQRGIRLSVAKELNPASFKIFDVLILMMARITEEAKSICPNQLDSLLSEPLFRQIERWFGEEVNKDTVKRTVGASAEAGAGAKEGSFLASLLGLFASVKGEIKYASDRSSEVVEYRIKRLPELMEICNKLIDRWTEALKQAEEKEWLFIIEDLDKTGISPSQLQELFIQYGTVFQDLRVNMIFTIPVWLAYSPDAIRLPFDSHMVPDTPIFDVRHEPHESGRSAVRAVLEARMKPELFDEGQMERLIVASGGNIRELFALVLDASEIALMRDSNSRTIEKRDCTTAINSSRRDYRRKLGQSPYDREQIGYEQKLPKLLAVYKHAPDINIPDPALYSLLRARAIQEFNGEGWFGVHPIVVDILKEQGHLQPGDAGGTE